jgi:quinol-cytochrome oxidoreductase complex cytochrome b subunit
MRLFHKNFALKMLNQHLGVYPSPMNLNWNWSWGSLSGLLLGSQILTGIFLAMHYVGHVDHAFASVQHLMVDVPSGMILRYAHANGASLFFTVVYLHILRGLYYSSGNQPRELLWISGVVILLLMILTAFIGYVLPWGQMSFWGITVITSLVTVIPVVGKQIVYWIWGGFSIDHPTLNRFYSLHYTLPFLLAGLSIFHIAALHQYGSTNPLGINTQSSTIQFGPYFGVKDLVAFLFLLLVFAILVFFFPEYLGQLAVQVSNYLYYYNAICWELLLNNSAHLVSLYKAYLAKIYYLVSINLDTTGQSAGNKNYVDLNSIEFNHLLLMVMSLDASLSMKVFSSSETTRVTSYYNYNFNFSSLLFHKTTSVLGKSESFYWWFAGLTDGDGSLLISKDGYLSYELTLDEKDIQCLYMIKGILKVGSITKRTNVKAYRIRIQIKADVLNLYQNLKGKLLTKSKYNQLNNISKLSYNTTVEIVSKEQAVDIIKNTAWLTGFFDAEGSFVIMNKFILTFNISQKEKHILELIKESLNLGHIRYDKSWDGWTYTISDREGIRFILDYLTKYPCQTTKHIDVITFKRLLYFMDNKYHFKNNPKRIMVEDLIKKFKSRYKKPDTKN